MEDFLKNLLFFIFLKYIILVKCMEVKYRIDLHKIPEIGENLKKTKKYILKILKKYKCKIEVLNSSIICFFDFKSNYSIAFRSDMDDLDIDELTNLKFKSNKYMHACGHDGHMAILLKLAYYLSNLNKLDKNIVLIFQEAEELGIGANKIISSNILDKYNIKYVFAYHLWPKLEFGKIFSKPYYMTAFSSEIEIEVFGKSTHIKDYLNSIDSLYVTSNFLIELNNIKKGYEFLLKFGIFNSGKIQNVISDYSILKGSLRTFDFLNFIDLYKTLLILKENYQKNYNVKINIILKSFNFGVYNDYDLYLKAQKLINISKLEYISLAAEDFSYFGIKYPCLLMFLGIGDVSYLHSNDFDFNMDVLDIGFKNYVKLLDIDFN